MLVEQLRRILVNNDHLRRVRQRNGGNEPHQALKWKGALNRDGHASRFTAGDAGLQFGK